MYDTKFNVDNLLHYSIEWYLVYIDTVKIGYVVRTI